MKTQTIFSFSLVLAGLFLMSACENDLKDVEKVSSRKVDIPIDRSYGVQVLYSDSAIVKAKLTAAQIDHYKTKDPYFEMTKGVTVLFFDENQKETSRVTSDYAIQRENEKIVELRKNVVATNVKGETFKSDELIWDENKKRFHSDKVVSITTKSQTIYGTSFWANEGFTYYEINQGSGNFNVQENTLVPDSGAKNSK